MSVATAHGLATQQRSRAESTLFMLHYKRTLFPLLIAHLGIVACFMAGFWAYTTFTNAGAKQVQEFRQAVDIIAIVLGVVMALPVGTAVFSRSFKEQQILFFHSLPLTRWRQWLMLVSSSAAALLTSCALAVVIRPGTLNILLERSGSIGVFAGVFVVISFAAGACFALVFTRPIAVYSVAYVLTWAFTMGTGFMIWAPYAIFVGLKTESARYRAFGLAIDLPLSVIVLNVVLFILMFLACSVFFYTRGEFLTLRTQLRNFAIVLVAGAVITFIVTPLAMKASVASEPLSVRAQSVSPDGQYVAQHLSASGYPWRAKIRFFNIDTGKSQTINTPGFLTYWWTDNSNLAVVQRDMSFVRLKPGDRISFFAPTGHLIRENRFTGQEIAAFAATPADVIVTGDGQLGHLIETRPESAPREILAAPLDHPTNVWLGRDALIFRNRVATPRAWTFDRGVATEVPWAKVRADRDSPVLLRGTVYPDSKSAMRQLEREAPLPRSAGEIVVYAIPDFAARWEAMDCVYGLRVNASARKSELYVLHKLSPSWQLIDSSIPMQPEDRYPQGVNNSETRFAVLADVDRWNRVAFVSTSTGKPMLRFHDAEIGKTFDVQKLPELNPRLSVFTIARRRKTSIFSAVVRHENDPTRSQTIAEFFYDGALHPIPTSFGSLAAHRADGTLIFATENGVALVSPNGQTREVQLSQR